jgi:hypothetical protein
MCGGCLAQWAAVSVPVGAGVGALIGFTIDRANTRTVFAAPMHRKVLVTPLASPHAIGALATIRF